jgi:predicted nucleotidyltransferase
VSTKSPSPGWDPRLFEAIRSQEHPLAFVTVSGAHLYGFPSPDSDFDLRGVHVLSAEDVVGLRTGPETVEVSCDDNGLELDLVTHDVGKFIRLLLTRNGYVLEQLLSPLVLHTTAVHAELVSLAPGCITRHHQHHCKGFAHTQWGLFEKESPPRVKPLLYIYRVLLTGIHLLRTGIVEANLLRLNDEYHLPWIPELVARKVAGAEQSTLTIADVERHRPEFERLLARLAEEHARSSLPEAPSARPALHDLLVRLRMKGLGAGK